MGILQTRPDALNSEGTVTNIGGGSLADNNDSTYKIFAPPSHTDWHHGDISGIDGVTYRILQVRPIARWRRYNGDFTINSNIELVDGGAYMVGASLGGSGHGTFTTWGSWFQNNGGGGEWTQAQVNAARVKFIDFGGGSTGPEVIELYMETEYHTRPNVSNVGPSGTNPGATRRPNVTWSFSDPDGLYGQAGYRVKVFTAAQGNPDVGSPVWDSGDVGNGNQSRTIDFDLNDGTYWVYVKVAKWFRSAYWWSAWGSNSFTISFPPGAPSALQRTGEESDTTPNFAVYLSDLGGQQAKARFEIYQSNRTTLVGTVDSAYLSSDGTATAEYSSALGVATYSVRAKSIDSGGTESGYTGWVDFDVTQIVTKDLVVNYDVKQEVSKSINVLWDVNANNTKDFTFLWDINELIAPKDMRLLWDVETPWIKVPEGAGVWAKVREL